MKRRYRLALSILVALGSVGLVVGLVTVGTATEGPLSASARRLGAWVRDVESWAVRGVRGPGRTADLAWLAPLRANADSLRHPNDLLLGIYMENAPVTLVSVTVWESPGSGVEYREG